MIVGATVGYDVVFLVHIVAALATVTVFVAMRASALQVAHNVDAATQRKRFPRRRNLAARFIHVLPATGLVMSLTGGASVSLTHPWILVGIGCYLAAAGHLEARILPMERAVAEVIDRDGVAPPVSGRALVRSIDTLLVLVGVALVSMVVQY